MSAKRPKPIVPSKRRDPLGTFEDAKGLIVEILAASGGKLAGKTRLYKTFYASHLFFAKSVKEYLTQHPMARMPNGPGIDQGDRLLRELEAEGRIVAEQAAPDPWGNREWTFKLVVRAEFDPNSPRGQAIRSALQWAQNKSAKALSDETHEFSHGWKSRSDGDEIDVIEELLTPAERGERERLLSEMEDLVGRAFGQSQ